MPTLNDNRIPAKEFIKRFAKANSVLPTTEEAAQNMYKAAKKIGGKNEYLGYTL